MTPRKYLQKHHERLYVYLLANNRNLIDTYFPSTVKPEWTLEACKKSALKYKTRSAWKKNEESAYNKACREGWLHITCSHMPGNNRKPNGYWTFDRCLEDALKYKTRAEWRKANVSAHQQANIKGWLGEVCKHVPDKHHSYWTLERCKEDVIGYENRTAWKKSNGQGYTIAKRNGWLDEIWSHVTPYHRPVGYWTLERCTEDALKYRTRSEWQNANAAAYQATSKEGWLDQACAHMQPTRKPVGYWTLERCTEDALKYKTRTEWQNKSMIAYQTARRKNWLDITCGHMPRVEMKPKGYWTLERCKKSALKYKTKADWRRGDSGGYSAAKWKGWFEECTAHMEKRKRKPDGYWTLERCKKSAIQYDTITEWHNGEGGAHAAAKRRGWFGECTAHMRKKDSKPSGYWTLKRCKKSALGYKTKADWDRGDNGAYQAAMRNKDRGWYAICTKHM